VSLDWRQAAIQLRSDDVRAFCSPPDYDRECTSFYGVEPEFEEVLEVAWRQLLSEEAFGVLLELTDADVRYIYDFERSLRVELIEEVLFFLYTIVECHQIEMNDLRVWDQARGARPSGSLGELNDKLAAYVDELDNRRRASLSRYADAISDFVEWFIAQECKPTGYVSGMAQARRRNSLHHWLEDYVLRYDHFPVGEHSVEDVGTVAFAAVPNATDPSGESSAKRSKAPTE